jgi:hypothetical protein
MPTKTETLGAGAFIKSEANGELSREAIVLASGAGALLAGTVLGKITASGKYKAYDNDAADGTQTAAAILFRDTDATSADVAAVGIVRLAEVWRDRLVWGAVVTTQAEKDAAYVDMATVNIAVRF